MTRPRKPPRYTVIPHPDATADVATLATYGPEVVAAAVAIADDPIADCGYGRLIRVRLEGLSVRCGRSRTCTWAGQAARQG